MIKISKHNRWIGNNSARLKKMHNNNPYCVWCGEETILYERHMPYQSDRAATTDHLFVRKDPRRINCKRRGIPSLIVLSCYKCNHQRGSIFWEKFCKIKNVDINFDFVYH